ncbi:SAM-dependent methyltransferase [Natronolimnohabitans innermongolicus]|uniref:Methyltransferase type 11 n=1 Tax=Natronolimnohabitans innermongolicus JCM 12255 TaxID=1227499 RepID=L9WI82_9EURY|nr:class I SAM-dependent methyltransferase [Natronolimnohabitans innermongolicus]ELY49220.1 methyltransferase type 11 [Natronolimnohabitans innermongolicus JCM 12255]
MQPNERSITDNYDRTDLEETILTAYENAGKDPATLTRDDTAALDEFHIQGRDATRALADLVDLQADDRVLDVGSGVGGPARTLAAEFDCDVTGVDLVEEYCRAATMLTERVGLEDRVTFQHGTALDLPFEDETFDVVWLQHVAVNVEDKARLFEELRRVLRPGGRLAIHEICAGAGGSPQFPVPWATDPSISFLVAPDELTRLLSDAGFDERAWTDTTAESLDWFRGQLERAASRPADASPPVGLNLLMGPETPTKMQNVVHNLEEERIEVVQGVLTAPESD